MMTTNNFFLKLILLAFFIIFISPNLKAETVQKNNLNHIKVTTLSKTPERPIEIPGSIFLLTSEDIRRSGATSIAEALRLVPGMHVARVNSHSWSITSRGFNGPFANKLLVMIDGRSIYNPLFSGVNWDVRNPLIEDIKRIEVVKGPGASVWGANAMNGVINIITKQAKETQGNMITSRFGTAHTGYEFSGRNGGKINENTYYRAYIKRLNLDETTETLGGLHADDSWGGTRTGFRVDWDDNDKNQITVQGDLYNQDKYGRQTGISLNPVEQKHHDHGATGNMLTRWTHTKENSESILQLYYDHHKRDSLFLEQKQDIFDIDFQNSFNLNEKNQFIWGMGYRHYINEVEDSIYFDFIPDKRSDNLYSAFLQNKYAIIDDKLFFTIGSKFERNDLTGFEYQPTARISWLPTNTETIWAAVSKAIRTPSFGEDGINFPVATWPSNSNNPVGLVKRIGNRQVESEELISYEMGYKSWLNSKFYFDVSTFFNDYDNILSHDDGSIVNTEYIFNINSDRKAESYGAEISSTWDATDKWRLVLGYSIYEMNIEKDSLLPDEEGQVPEYQWSLRSHYNIRPNIEMDNIIYYVDDLDAIANVKNYTRFDTRLAWRPAHSVELSLVGQNLFDEAHQEFSPALHTKATEIGRSVYLKALWKF